MGFRVLGYFDFGTLVLRRLASCLWVGGLRNEELKPGEIICLPWGVKALA